MKTARILYVDHAIETGGAQKSLLDLLRHLDKRRFEPVLLHAPGAQWAAQAAAAGVRLREARLCGPLFQVRRESLRPGLAGNLGAILHAPGPVLEVLQAIRHEGADLVHSNTLKTHLIAGLAARLARRPVVWHVRDILDPGPARRLLQAAARLLRPHVIAISEAVMATLDTHPDHLKTVVHNGVDLAALRPRTDRAAVRKALGIPDEALVFITVGRLSPWKGHKTLMEAFGLLPDLGDVRLLVVGDCAFWEKSYRRELEEFAQQQGIADRTIFTGHREDVPDLLAASDVFCLPSRNEPFGRVIIEAMAVGLPVVATRGGGVPEIIQDGQEGLLVPIDSPRELADALAQLLKDPAIRRQMGEAGRRRVRERFDLRVTVKAIESIYEGLLGHVGKSQKRRSLSARTRRSNPLLKRLDSWTGTLVLSGLSAFERLRRHSSAQIKTKSVKRILVIKLCCMGDGLLAVPAIRATAQHFPNASITCLCTSRNRDVFEGLPYFDEIISLGISGTGGMREMLAQGMPGLLKIVMHLRQRRFDIVIDLDLYYKATAIIAYLTGAPIRAGFDTEGTGRGRLYTHRVPRRRDRHEVECFLDVVASIGVKRAQEHLEFVVDPENETAAERLLADEGITPDTPFAVLVPGSSKNWPQKQWPADRFAAVGDALAQQYGLGIVLVGASFERELCARIAAQMKTPAVNLAGKATIKQTGHVLRRAVLTVSNDTGPMHLSAAVGTPVVAVFGPTDERKWRPWGDEHVVIAGPTDCRPCYYLSAMPVCQHLRCLMELPVEAVLSACQRVLSQSTVAG